MSVLEVLVNPFCIYLLLQTVMSVNRINGMIREIQLHCALVSSCCYVWAHACIHFSVCVWAYMVRNVAIKDFLTITQLQPSFDRAKPQEEKDDRPGAAKAFKCCLCCRCLDSPFAQTLRE